jgi:hypothetical protein
MEFLKEAQRATLKTNTYINDNGDSLIDLLLLLVTPLVAIDVLRQLFAPDSMIWVSMTFLYISIFMLIPTLWLRSTVESKDPDRDFISYLGSSKTYLTNLILILVIITYIKMPEAANVLDGMIAAYIPQGFAYTEAVLAVISSLIFLRLSFLIPLYTSGLNLSYKQALEATKGKSLALAATIIRSALPLLIFTAIYAFFIVPWAQQTIFADASTKVITMILLAPVKYLVLPLILIYAFTALAYHYANYAKQYLVLHKDDAKKVPEKKEMH